MNLIKLELIRYTRSSTTTLGQLFIRKKYECFTLEDGYRETKIYGKTRIPAAGQYQIKLRTQGRLHEKYKLDFPSFHIGMLHLQDVPNFSYIYMHIGTTHIDTLGCPLVGKAPSVDKLRLYNSTDAYENMYKQIAPLVADEKNNYVYIKIKDERV